MGSIDAATFTSRMDSNENIEGMGKQQLSTIDVAAEVAWLRQRILGMGLINVFDINPKTYILKLGKTGDNGEKVFLLLESGSRLHTTQYERKHGQFPSNFNLKLRKHIRNRRLNDVRQLGVDRIVDFTFGVETKAIHLILEMYAQGNIVLTDHNYEVLTLLRTHTDPDHDYVLLPKKPYPVQHIRMPKTLNEAEVLTCLFQTTEGRTMKSIVSTLLPFGSACADHVILSAGLQPSMVFPEGEIDAKTDRSDEQRQCAESAWFQKLLREIKQLEQWFRTCSTSPPSGYILTKDKKPGVNKSGSEKQTDDVLYIEFEPFLLHPHKHRQYIQFDSFNAALDEFFSKKEGQKIAQAEAAAQAAAEARLRKTKEDLERRAAQLHEEAAKDELQGQLIEYHLTVVDEVLLAVNSVLASGMKWDDVETLIKSESEQGNPIASHVHTLHFAQNSAVLLLDGEGLVTSDNATCQKTRSPVYVKVMVDLSLGAAANARMHFERRKKFALKERKTHEANAMAIKAAERKIQEELKKSTPTASLHQLRKLHWFEKFNWFITNENYLVISGRDAQQNELLVKRYMKKDDIYVHADLHGASTTIIKNYKPVPPMSLQQAGVSCICRSKAWESKQITSAWWVYAEQVSKTAPSGEYLTTGSFMIRGRKNFLPPASLIFGFGFMFKLEDACIDRHKGERTAKIEEPLMKDSAETSMKDSGVELVEETEEGDDQQRSPLDAFLDGSAEQNLKMTRQSKQSTVRSVSGTERAKTVTSMKKDKEGKKSKEESPKKGITEQQRKKQQNSSKNKKKGKKAGRDEEDLQLMAELLQSTGQKKTRQQRRDKRKQKKEEKRAELKAMNTALGMEASREEVHQHIAKAIEVPFASDHTSDDRKQSSENDSAYASEADQGQEEGREEEEVATDMAEIRQLHSLTSTPYSDDTLLFAVPCCGAYDAFVNFKYKVKLIPGSLKKGKGGKQARDLILHLPDLPSREGELIKTIPESEVTHVMLGLVKLSMPGMQKIKQTQKAAKKKKKG